MPYITTCNTNESPLTLDQLGAINMTKSTSKVKSFNVLIAVTGSVAAIKLIELIRKLHSAFPRSYTSMSDHQTYKATISIKVVMTENSKKFVPKEEVSKNCTSSAAPFLEVLDDADEWTQWTRIGDPILHIELRKWADLCLIAPLDANTMAKLASGICDNLLTCIVRAWDISKPIIYCPAMNVHMYNHPITNQHLEKLDSFGYQRVDCIEKRLACGDIGLGAMATVDNIVEKVVDCLMRPVSRSNVYLRSQKQKSSHSLLASSKQNTSSVIEGLRSKSIQNGLSNHNIASISASLDCRNPSISPGLKSDNGSFMFKSNQVLSFKNGHFSRDEFNENGSALEPALPRKKLSNIVTSLQNLKAIDVNPEAKHDLNDPDDINNDESATNGCVDYDQPSNVMVHDLFTNELLNAPSSSSSTIHRLDQQKSSSTSASKSNIANNHGLGTTKLSRTLADPSAFLSQCFNKNRNCFTCVICKNDYKNRKSMSRHLKEQHLQGNIHRCAPCGVSYKRREKLIKHNREHHGMDC